MKSIKVKKIPNQLAKQVGEALKRSARLARKIAKMHGTKVIILRDGKIVAEKP